MKAKAKTRGRWKIVLAGLLVVVAVVVGGYFYLKPDNQPASPSDSSHEVGVAGGTFSFHDGIEITVPEGAVEDGTTLTVGDISQPEHAPFDGMRTGAVMFDVSLAKDGNDGIQPAVPLDIVIPLQGNLLPDGANPESALLYTANESGDGFWYVPPPLDENGVPVLEESVVHGKLLHLSPKYVSYLDEGKFLEEFGMIDGGIAEPEDCLESVETSAGEVKLGPKDGWSNTDPASPINVCLAADGDGTHVGIVNRLNYVLSVASTTDSDQFNVSFGGFDEEMVKLFAEAIFPNPVIDTFLGRGGELDVAFAPDQLPATIQLQANPNTYLSEIGWFALKFLVNVFTGGATNMVVQAVLETADVASCLQTTFDIAEGDVEGFGLIDAINYISSKCVEAVAKAVGYQPGFWDLLGRAFNVVAEGIAGGLQTITTAFEGIRMQFVGNLTVEVLPVVSYVGRWCLRAYCMTVNPDGTGMAEGNDGPCGSNESDFCEGFVEFTWTLEDGELHAIITDRWSEGASGTTYTPEADPDALWWSDIPGETFTLYDLNGQSSVEFIRNNVEDSSHHLCGPSATDDDLVLCGLL